MSNELDRLINMMGAKEQKQFYGMLYGNSGTGKTHQGTRILDRIVPPGKTIIHLDTSGNFYRLNHAEMGLSHKFIPLPFTTVEDIELLIDAIAWKQAPFDTVGGLLIDELSTIASEDLDRVYESRRANNPAIEDTADWGDFRPALTRIRTKILNKIVKVPDLHTVLIAHERTDAKTNIISADFSAATLKKVKEKLHLVARITAEQNAAPGSDVPVYSRMAQVHPSKSVDAKAGIGVSLVKFDAEFIPDGVKKWLDRGAQYDSGNVLMGVVPEAKPENKVFEGKSLKESQDIAESVDFTPTDTTSESDTIMENPFAKIED